MNYGVVIEQGPQDWQILQQDHGSADITLSGVFSRPDSIGADEPVRVYGRVVREDSGIPLTDWIEAETEENRFAILLKQIPAGGLYRIETCMPREGNGWNFDWAVRGDIRHHIGIGDVFVIAGQSNAKGFGREPAYDPPHLGVHIQRQSGRWDLATQPLGDSTDILWAPAEDRSVTGYSPYLSFARGLADSLGYPIGLIQTSKGGSPLEQWNPTDGPLFEGMLRFIQSNGGKVKAILWYQGCSDANESCSGDYLERFRCMVDGLREKLGYEVPFLTCQLNRCLDSTEDVCWSRVRQAQLEAALTIRKVFVVSTVDLRLAADGIHNDSSSVIMLGERLARAAMAWIYGKGVFVQPYPVSAERVDASHLRLHFAGIYGEKAELKQLSKRPENLPVAVFAGEEKIRITGFEMEDGCDILLETEQAVPDKAMVSVLWGANPKGILLYERYSFTPCLAGNAAVNRTE